MEKAGANMKTVKKVLSPRMQMVGMVSHPVVNNGAPVPVYENIRDESRPDINTLEGWNQKSREINSHATPFQLKEMWALWRELQDREVG